MRGYATPLVLCTTMALGGAAFGQAQPHDHDHDAPAQVAPPVDMENPPRLEIEQVKHDFGTIPDTEQVSVQFPFRNTGTGRLIITNIRSTCGCTVPRLDKTEYEPGESGEITVNFDPTNRTGTQHRTVTVFSNDPQRPSTELVIDAFVRKLVEITPPMLRMGNVPFGESHSLLVDVTLRDPAMELVDAKISRGEGLSLDRLPAETIEEQGEVATRETLMLHLSETTPIGPIQGAVTLTLQDGSGKQSVQTVAVLGEVIGDILLAPAQLNVGSVSSGEPIVRHLRATSRNSRPFKILRLEERPLPGLDGNPRDPQLQDIDFELIAPDDGSEHRYMMKVTFVPRPEVQRQFYTQIAAITDRKDQPEILVRVLGRLQGDAEPPALSIPVGPAPAEGEAMPGEPDSAGQRGDG